MFSMLLPFIRIVAGLGIIVFTITTWKQNSAHIATGETPRIFGQAIDITGTPLTAIFVLMGLFGLGLILMGIAALLRKP